MRTQDTVPKAQDWQPNLTMRYAKNFGTWFADFKIACHWLMTYPTPKPPGTCLEHLLNRLWEYHDDSKPFWSCPIAQSKKSDDHPVLLAVAGLNNYLVRPGKVPRRNCRDTAEASRFITCRLIGYGAMAVILWRIFHSGRTRIWTANSKLCKSATRVLSRLWAEWDFFCGRL